VKRTKVVKLGVHSSPHLDELVAVHLLRNYGEEKIPGVSTAVLTTYGKTELQQLSPETAAMQGILLVGIGGGMFDEHGRRGSRQDCAATLVAKHLGLDEDLLWPRFLRNVFLADAENRGPYTFVAELVKKLNRYWVGTLDPELLYKQVEPIIIALRVEVELLAEAEHRFRKAYKREINGYQLVAVDQLDNVEFQHVANRAGVNVVVQRGRDGLTQILMRHASSDELDVPGLAVRIRKAEMAKSGIRPKRFLDDRALSAMGTLSDIPQWYVEKGNLLNGSESFRDVPPSGISFADLVHVVEKHLRELDDESDPRDSAEKSGKSICEREPAPTEELPVDGD